MPPLAGSIPTGGATAQITGKDSLEVKVEGLPTPGTGAYRLWLFTSVLDSRPIGSLRSGSGTIAATLPENAAKYRYLDLTREQSPTDRLYSGIVVLRLPVQSLLAPGGRADFEVVTAAIAELRDGHIAIVVRAPAHHLPVAEVEQPRNLVLAGQLTLVAPPPLTADEGDLTIGADSMCSSSIRCSSSPASTRVAHASASPMPWRGPREAWITTSA